MIFNKKDDQTLSTIARIATQDPKLAKSLAINSQLVDQTIDKQTKKFWSCIDIEKYEDDYEAVVFLCRHIQEISDSSEMVNKLRTTLSSRIRTTKI